MEPGGERRRRSASVHPGGRPLLRSARSRPGPTNPARRGISRSPRPARSSTGRRGGPAPRPIVIPPDTFDGAETGDEGRSFGVVDDTCEARIEVRLALGGRSVAASANVFVGPPDFAPDRRPFLSVADELNDRQGDGVTVEVAHRRTQHETERLGCPRSSGSRSGLPPSRPLYCPAGFVGTAVLPGCHARERALGFATFRIIVREGVAITSTSQDTCAGIFRTVQRDRLRREELADVRRAHRMLEAGAEAQGVDRRPVETRLVRVCREAQSCSPRSGSPLRSTASGHPSCPRRGACGLRRKLRNVEAAVDRQRRATLAREVTSCGMLRPP